MIDRIMTIVYLAIALYFVVAYFVTGNELALLVSLWSGAMLEIRTRHNITITFTIKERRNDDDGNNG